MHHQALQTVTICSDPSASCTALSHSLSVTQTPSKTVTVAEDAKNKPFRLRTLTFLIQKNRQETLKFL